MNETQTIANEICKCSHQSSRLSNLHSNTDSFLMITSTKSIGKLLFSACTQQCQIDRMKDTKRTAHLTRNISDSADAISSSSRVQSSQNLSTPSLPPLATTTLPVDESLVTAKHHALSECASNVEMHSEVRKFHTLRSPSAPELTTCVPALMNRALRTAVA